MHQLADLQELNRLAMDLARREARNAARQSDGYDHRGQRDHHGTFNQHAQTVRQCIALEVRLSADVRTAQPRVGAREPIPDPRRSLLQTVLHHHVRHASDGARLRLFLDEAIHRALLDDPNQQRPVLKILEDIASRFRIAIQSAQLTDEILAYRTPHERNTASKP